MANLQIIEDPNTGEIEVKNPDDLKEVRTAIEKDANLDKEKLDEDATPKKKEEDGIATAADFRKGYETTTHTMRSGQTVKFRKITNEDHLALTREILAVRLIEMGYPADDLVTAQKYLREIANTPLETEFVLELAKQVIVAAMVAPEFTSFPIVAANSIKVPVGELGPDAIFDLYEAITVFSGLREPPKPQE